MPNITDSARAPGRPPLPFCISRVNAVGFPRRAHDTIFLFCSIPAAVLSYLDPSPLTCAAEPTSDVLPILAADAAGAWSNW